jgi:hypothetical protein
MTGDNWHIGTAFTCPNELGNWGLGPGGLGPGVTISEVLIDGGPGPDTPISEGPGPWEYQGGGFIPHGGNYQLRVKALDLRCLWHIAVYPS